MFTNFRSGLLSASIRAIRAPNALFPGRSFSVRDEAIAASAQAGELTTIEMFKENMKFSAGHFTIFNEREREMLHGHNHSVHCCITGLIDNRTGMILDYGVFKRAVRSLCDDWDERMLIPTRSPFLRVHATDERVEAEFGPGGPAHQFVFPRPDVLLLPVANITLEELSRLFTDRLVDRLRHSKAFESTASSADPATASSDFDSAIAKIEVKISSSPGQFSAAVWRNPRFHNGVDHPHRPTNSPAKISGTVANSPSTSSASQLSTSSSTANSAANPTSTDSSSSGSMWAVAEPDENDRLPFYRPVPLEPHLASAPPRAPFSTSSSSSSSSSRRPSMYPADSQVPLGTNPLPTPFDPATVGPTELERPGLLVITGGSRGIGRQVVERFLARGWAVVAMNQHPVNDLDPAFADGRVHDVFTDVSCMASVERALQSVHAQWDKFVPPTSVARSSSSSTTDGTTGMRRICLVHNAASHASDSVRDFLVFEDATKIGPGSVPGIDRPFSNGMLNAMQMNVVVPSVLNGFFIPRMVPGSSIVYIGSTLAEKAVANRASYVASKHAVAGLMRATAQDLFGSGIHTACICPGFTDTLMLRSAFDAAKAQGVHNVESLVTGMVSFRRLVQPTEIARLVETVAHEPMLNGSTIHANLGQKEF